MENVFIENDRVEYTDEHGTRKGTIIELNDETQRARIKWDEKRPRTWIRYSALKLITAILLSLLSISCHKSIDSPPAPVTPKYRLVIRCLDYKRDTLYLRNGMVIPRWLCTKSVTDTVKY